MPFDLVLPSGKVTLGDMAKQSPGDVNITGGRAVKLRELGAFNGSIDALKVKSLEVPGCIGAGDDVVTVRGLTLEFSEDYARIRGDFSNGVIARRLLFQDASQSGVTSLGVIPSGTSTDANMAVFAGRDPDNTNGGLLSASATATFLLSFKTGTGTAVPLSINVNSVTGLTMGTTGVSTIMPAVATPAGGSTSACLLFGTTAGFGVYYGSGAPTVVAAKGSIYLRSDGSGTNNRAYIATDSAGTWTAIVTVA